MKYNECIICGEFLENPHHDYCPECYRKESYDTCVCGKRKKYYYDLCRDCEQLERENENRKNYGADFCPICGQEFIFSSFLHGAIPNEKTRLIANLITHYRHVHQPSWNTSCHYISRYYGETAYENSKKEHNNRAKRQIVRKCKDWLIAKGITKQDLLDLKDNDEKTIALIDKAFHVKVLNSPTRNAL